jgi:hypothetical protein
LAVTTRDGVLTLALQSARVLAAGQSPRAADVALAANFLDLELASLQSRSDILVLTPRASLTLVAGTASYALPSTVIDVRAGINGEMGTIVPSSGGETQVFACSRDEYQAITEKTSSGRPTRVYVERLATLTAYFWPVPDATSVSWTYTAVQAATLPAGASALELQKRWWKAIMLAVSADVARAKSMPLDLSSDLRAESQMLYQQARGADTQRGPIRLVLRHDARRW